MSQWLPSISLNEANSSVFFTLQIILRLKRYCVLRVLMMVAALMVITIVRRVLIIMSQVVVRGFSWVVPIIGRVPMSVHILIAAKIDVFMWVMYFLKVLMALQ